MEGKSPEADDIKLLRRTAAGEDAAFHQLIDRHAQRLYRLAVSLLGNATDAEDVLQETFVGAWRGVKGFESRASVKTWLTRILVTQVAVWRREHKRRRNEPMETASGKTVEAGGVGERLDLRAALHQLSDEHREVLMLREFESLTYDEISEVLGVPRGTVESRLHRARGELREKLKDYL